MISARIVTALGLKLRAELQAGPGRAVGAEALARWRHPRRGVVAPGAFVPVLEAAGEIDRLMHCMVAGAAAFARALSDAGEQHSIAVNVSIRSLIDLTLADEITRVVRGHGAEPRSMVLEITESTATIELGKVLENLARLRIKGFSLDDYGTGYSSLEQLTRIPFTELKIDQSFVTHAGRHETAKVILSSSLEMAHRLHLTAIAEGVETRANWELLLDLGRDLAQGYYVARPMAAADYVDWLAAWPRLRGDDGEARTPHSGTMRKAV